MPQQFTIDIPKAELASFLKDLKTEPAMKLISQEEHGDIVTVVTENTLAPDAVPNDNTPPPPPPPPGSLKAKPGKNEAVVDALIAGAIKHGLDPMMILTFIAIESNYKPTICNQGSSAAGLFQFIDSTWATVGGPNFPGRGGKGNGQAAGASVNLQVELGCKFTQSNMAQLKAKLGLDADATRIYMAHQQGLGGALAILKANQANPNAAIETVISAQAAKLNGFGGLTVAQTVAKFDALVQKKAVVARAQVLP